VNPRPDAPTRSVLDVGPGDYVKTAAGEWRRITFNTAYGANPDSIRRWTIGIEGGAAVGMFAVLRYAKAEDFEEVPAG
jgi:hypothetical protein